MIPQKTWGVVLLLYKDPTTFHSFLQDDKQKGKHFWYFQYFEVILTPVDCIGFICNWTEEDGVWCGWRSWWETKPSVFDYNLCGACSMKCITMDSFNRCKKSIMFTKRFPSILVFFSSKTTRYKVLFLEKLACLYTSFHLPITFIWTKSSFFIIKVVINITVVLGMCSFK